MGCVEKHTKFQPSDEQWFCPRCGANVDDFYVYTSIAPECGLLHVDDEIVCDACGSVWSGKAISTVLLKKSNLVQCPHCRGKGVVPKSE